MRKPSLLLLLNNLPRLGLGVIAAMILAVIAMQVIFRLDYNTQLNEQQAKELLTALRKSMVTADQVVLPSSVKQLSGDQAPMVMTVWINGRRSFIVQTDESLGEGMEHLSKKLIEIYPKRKNSRIRLQLDVVVAKGWIPQEGLLASLSFVDGHDGIGAIVGGTTVYLPPSELIRKKKYGTFKPLPGYDSKFKIGLDIQKVKKTIRNQAKYAKLVESDPKDLDVTDISRFRALTVVEGDDLKPLRLFKATVERPAPTKKLMQDAVVAGAEYLDRALKKDGMFRYYYNPVRDRDERGKYNWPRHAGVAYSLALVGRILDKPKYVDTARRALMQFEKKLVDGPEGSKCLISDGKCYLGSSALGLLALAEYRIASGDARFDASARQVAQFIVFMQKENGFFYHDWIPQKGINKKKMKFYASQQAVLSLARYAKALGDKQILSVAEKGMDYLAGPYWDHFLGTFFFGQEHWTCLAAEEVYNSVPKKEYARLCYEIGIHYDNITHKPWDTPWQEDVGGMSITHLFTPHLGGTATAAEAMVSSIILGNALGEPTESISEQLRVTYGFLMKGQVTAHDTFWMKTPKDAIGGIYETQIKTAIRIDTVQHAISAMVRGLSSFN